MIRTLEENGFNALQARSLIEVWEEATEHRDVKLVNLLKNNFATKEDLANLRTEVVAIRGELKSEMSSLRGELKAEISNLRTEVFGIRGELKSEIASLRSDLTSEMISLRGDLTSEMVSLRGEFNTKLEQFKSEMIKWMFGLLISQAALVLGAVLFIVSRLP
jgi:dsDNA-specific endonuclease/ATPase MutS2